MLVRTWVRGVGLAAVLTLSAGGAAQAATGTPGLVTVHAGHVSLIVPAGDASGLRAAIRRSRAEMRRVERLRRTGGRAHGRGPAIVLTRQDGFRFQDELAGAANQPPTLVVTYNDGTNVSYYEPYQLPTGQQLYSDTTELDNGSPGPATQTIGTCEAFPGESYDGISFGQRLLANDTYDCNAPDDNGAGQSPASAAGAPNGSNVTLVSSGFRCEATVGEGTAGNTPHNIITNVSGEDYQSYTDVAGQSVASINTTCSGFLPAGATVPTTSTPNQVACSEKNPFGRGYVRGYGISYTSEYGTYVESCNDPDYPVPASAS